MISVISNGVEKSRTTWEATNLTLLCREMHEYELFHILLIFFTSTQGMSTYQVSAVPLQCSNHQVNIITKCFWCDHHTITLTALPCINKRYTRLHPLVLKLSCMPHSMWKIVLPNEASRPQISTIFALKFKSIMQKLIHTIANNVL